MSKQDKGKQSQPQQTATQQQPAAKQVPATDLGKEAPKQEVTAGTVVQQQPAEKPEPQKQEPAQGEGEKGMFEMSTIVEDRHCQHIVLQLTDYAEKMDAGVPQTAKSLETQQMLLFRIINAVVVDSTPKQFADLWPAVLDIVHQNRKGAFNELRIFRGFENLRLSQAQRLKFERMLHLLMATADPKGRELALKAINLADLLSEYPEEVKRNIMGFYK